jgi:hypothetical protein
VLGTEFESFSIGAGWCQALSDYSVDMVWDVTRRVLASLRDRHFGPPMMGLGGCGGPISRDVLAARLAAGIRTQNGLASSIVPAGTSLHRSAEFTFLLSCSIVHLTRCEIRRDVRHRCALTARSLDGERAHRANIRAAAHHHRTLPIMQPQPLPWSSEIRCRPPTCDA